MLSKLRLIDLRHTATSRALISVESLLPLAGEPLGHRRHRTMAGCAHLADNHLIETADQVGSIIAAAMYDG